jgi:hypothetical protein
MDQTSALFPIRGSAVRRLTCCSVLLDSWSVELFCDKCVVYSTLQTRWEKAASNIIVIWNMLPCNFLDRCVHLQGYQLPPSLTSTFKMEVVNFCK